MYGKLDLDFSEIPFCVVNIFLVFIFGHLDKFRRGRTNTKQDIDLSYEAFLSLLFFPFSSSSCFCF